jgi:hypothetical protein
MAMNLDDTQKKQVAGWIEEGQKLSEIQTRLETDLGLKMTYMEVRFLIDDLSLKLKEPDPPPEEPEQAPEEPAQPTGKAVAPDQAGLPPAGQEPGGLGGVSVTVDQVTRPGSMVSGRVTFSDSKGGAWYLDQTGRLGIATDEEGYKPSEQDVMAFQSEVQTQLGKLGY